MAIYDRTGTSSNSTATTAVMPSQDLGSVIVQSLQNAVEFIKDGDVTETSLKDSIQQGVDNSVLIQALRTSSSKISDILGNKSSSKDNVSEKALYSRTSNLIKSNEKLQNTKVQKQKDSPEEKVSKEVDDMLGLLKASDKREKDRDKEAKVTKKTEKKHQTSIKEGFSAVKAFGSAMLQKIGLVLIGLQLVAELIVLIKYGWHRLWGVFIPKTWVKIKTAWVGFWAKITTEIKNFFMGLINPIANKFGITYGLNEEDVKRMNELREKFAGLGSEGNTQLQNLAAGVKSKKAATEGIDVLQSRLEDMGLSRYLSKDMIEKWKNSIEEGKDISGEVNQWKTQYLDSKLKEYKDKGDIGNIDRMESLIQGIQDLHLGDVAKKVNDSKNAATYFKEKGLGSELKEYSLLLQGKHDPEIEKLKAQTAQIEKDLKSGKLNTMTIQELRDDESIGKVVIDTMNKVGADGIKVNVDDKHFQWLNNQGYEWLKSMSDLVNHATQNIGINLTVPEPTKYDNNPSKMNWFKSN